MRQAAIIFIVLIVVSICNAQCKKDGLKIQIQEIIKEIDKQKSKEIKIKMRLT